MPEEAPKSIRLHAQDIRLGETLALGTLMHTEEEIIAFAKLMDPLPMHTDPEAARKSIFGGIIASGAMLYIEAHKAWFVPMFGPSIVCGLGMRHWNFTKPHYPDTPYDVFLTAKEIAPNAARGTVQVNWYYEFKAADGTTVQDLELPVLHWLARERAENE